MAPSCESNGGNISVGERQIKELNAQITYALKSLKEDQARALLKPFIRDVKHIRSRKRMMSVCVIGVMCLVCYINVVTFADTKSGAFVGRRMMLTLIEFYDWPQLHNAPCIVNNPQFGVRHVTQEDCEFCESQTGINIVDEESELIPKYIKNGIPILVRSKYSAQENSFFHDIKDFVGLYLSKPDFSVYHPCSFSSNMKRRSRDHYHFMQQVFQGDVESFYAQWENCARQASKTFRMMYTRPSFLPMNIQLTDSNWVMLCNNYTGSYVKTVDVYSPLVLLVPQLGRVTVELEPVEVCRSACPTLRTTLSETDVLVLPTTDLWDVKYLPSCDNNQTILIAAGGTFD